jgi:acetyl esterase
MDSYLADAEDLRSPYVDCLAADLSDVPPCYVAAAQYDPLLDDSTALWNILTHHGIRCQLEVFPGVIHAFLHNSIMLDAAYDAVRHGAEFLKEIPVA